MLQKYLKKRGWSALILVRYALLHLPAIALLVMALIFVQRWVTIPAWVFCVKGVTPILLALYPIS